MRETARDNLKIATWLIASALTLISAWAMAAPTWEHVADFQGSSATISPTGRGLLIDDEDHFRCVWLSSSGNVVSEEVLSGTSAEWRADGALHLRQRVNAPVEMVAAQRVEVQPRLYLSPGSTAVTVERQWEVPEDLRERSTVIQPPERAQATMLSTPNRWRFTDVYGEQVSPEMTIHVSESHTPRSARGCYGLIAVSSEGSSVEILPNEAITYQFQYDPRGQAVSEGPRATGWRRVDLRTGISRDYVTFIRDGDRGLMRNFFMVPGQELLLVSEVILENLNEDHMAYPRAIENRVHLMDLEETVIQSIPVEDAAITESGGVPVAWGFQMAGRSLVFCVGRQHANPRDQFRVRLYRLIGDGTLN